MIPYLIPVILIIIGIYRYDVQQRSVNSRYLYWFIGLYLILLFGLRFQLGWDSRMYSGFLASVSFTERQLRRRVGLFPIYAARIPVLMVPL